MEKKGVINLKPLLKNDKAVKIIMFAGFALVIAIFLSDFIPKPKKSENPPSDNASFAEYEKELEEKLYRAIKAVDGVGEVTVMITLESLSENVFSEKGEAIKTVITPKVRGVAVICEGGSNIIVKQKVVELASKALGISTTKVCVTN